MQEFYRIVQGRSKKVQTIVLCMERALKAIKQPEPYAMTKKDGHRHLKDCLFHGNKPNFCNALLYLYDKPDSQYSQSVMALRKAETETLRSCVSEARGKSTVVGAEAELLVNGASPEPSYEAITQEIAYSMSVVANQTNQSSNKNGGYLGFKSNRNGKYPSTTFQRPERDKKNMACWGCRCVGHICRECSTPRQRSSLFLAQ